MTEKYEYDEWLLRAARNRYGDIIDRAIANMESRQGGFYGLPEEGFVDHVEGVLAKAVSDFELRKIGNDRIIALADALDADAQAQFGLNGSPRYERHIGNGMTVSYTAHDLRNLLPHDVLVVVNNPA